MDNVKSRRDTVVLNDKELGALLRIDRKMVIFYLENVLGHNLSEGVKQAMLECPNLNVAMVNGETTPWDTSFLTDN